MVTVHDVAVTRGLTHPSDEEYERVGMPAICSCFVCNKIIPHTSAFLSQGGRIKCIDHITGTGFRNPEQFEKYLTVFSLHKRDGGK